MDRTPTNLFDALANDQEFEPQKPCRPSNVQPGTKEKVRLMAERIEAGEELFHPDDPVHEHDFRAKWDRVLDPIRSRDLIDAVDLNRPEFRPTW